MQAESYALLNNISPPLVQVLKHLHKDLWTYMKRAQPGDGCSIVRTGYYSGYGRNSKRQSVALQISAAAEKAGFHVELFYENNKNSAPNERLKIIIVPTSVRITGVEALNQYLNR